MNSGRTAIGGETSPSPFRRAAVLGVLLIAFSCVTPAGAYVTDDDWVETNKSNEDLRVYTKIVEGQPIKAVKAVKTIDASIETLMTVLSDAALVPDWIPVIGAAQLLKKTDPDGVSVLYMVTKFPWPIKNRDIVVETATDYDPSAATVNMVSTDIDGFVDENPRLIRAPASFTRWKIAILGDRRLRIELTTHSDPGGAFPNWLANLIVARTPKTLFVKLQQTLDEEEARGRPFDEIFVFGKEVGL